MRHTVEGAKLNNYKDYYRIVDFIHRRCCELNGAVTRAFLTGERRLPAHMDIAIDSQSLMVNWPSRVQRRTVEMTSCCSVDAASRFILELDVNHDPRFDPFDVNHESPELGDMTRKEAFRKYARFWLAGDEMRSGRTGHGARFSGGSRTARRRASPSQPDRITIPGNRSTLFGSDSKPETADSIKFLDLLPPRRRFASFRP